MRTTLLALATGSLALAGCTPEPVDIPADLTEASTVCFGVQALMIRDESGLKPDDPIPLSAFSKIIQYPLIAAAKSDKFSMDYVVDIIPKEKTAFEDLELKDYAAALPACQKKFGIAGKDAEPSLPEPDAQAALSCYAYSQFYLGFAQGDGVDQEGKGDYYKGLAEKLGGTLDKVLIEDPELLARVNSGDETVLTDVLKEAFSEGNPQGYLEQCDKRFAAQ